MKSLTRLWKVLAVELGSRCSVDVSRDINTVETRTEHEGFSFLSIEMPDLCTYFEHCLEQGALDASLPRGWKADRSGKVPLFLGGFFRLVFDVHSGHLLAPFASCVDSVSAIRQLLLLYKKVEVLPDERRQRKAIDQFISCETELKRSEPNISLGTLPKTFAWLFSSVLNDLSQAIDNFDLQPSHGPGATADRKNGNKKFLFSRWSERLDTVFPCSDYAVPNSRYFDADCLTLDPPGLELPVRVILVPKTQKAPRIIAIEPSYVQFCQQAIAKRLKNSLKSDRIVGPMIDITDQSRNREMAKLGSITGRLATLDLSEASDRLLNSLVISLCRPWPSVVDGLQATRSRRASLPDGRNIRLSKFASMGSALCFPIESMVFLAIVVDSVLRGGSNSPICESDILGLHGKVSVYGDDIICPSYAATDVVGTLERFSLKVNTTKSFIHGPFKESCGGDFFFGHDVKPIKLKVMPRQPATDEEFVSLCSTRNQFYWAGLWETARYLDALLSKRWGYTIVPVDSSGVGRQSVLLSSEDKWNNGLQRWETVCLTDTAKSPDNKISGIAALHKCLTGDFTDPMFDGHLDRSGRIAFVNLKRRGVEAG